MNLSEHKYEAERLIDAANRQIELIQAESTPRPDEVLAFLGVTQVTVALAQVHATLATATDV